MVPKKGKSKRVTLKDKYKVQRKVAEAKRKAKKEAKKNPQSKKPKRDPGIPNMWPYKEQLLKQMEERKQRMEDEKARQKEARKRLVEKKRQSMQNMVKEAEKRTAEYDRKEAMVQEDGINTWSDNSRRAYFREFKKVVEESDVVLEVLDARDPMGCRCEHIEQMIMASGTGKHVVLVLNKIDLVPKEIVQKWLQYLRQYFPTVAFKASTQEQKQKLGANKTSFDNATEDMLQSSESLGTETLIKLLKNYCRSANIKKAITVGIVGYPNVGKSSLINSLKRSRTCTTGATPGVTKSLQTITLDKDIKLLDSPGIVFSSNNTDSDVILRNCVNVDTLPDPVRPVGIILERCNKEQIMQLYEVPAFANVTEFLMHLALRRGKLKKGGVADLDSAAKSVLQDWNAGTIPFYTTPPAQAASDKATIVTQFSQAFVLDSLVQDDAMLLDQLPSNTGDFITMAPGEAPALDDDAFNSDDDAMDDAMTGESDGASDGEDGAGDGDAMADDGDEPAASGPAAFKMTKAHLAAQDKKLKGRLVVRQQLMTEEEAQLNPQVNQSRRKAAKQARKEAAKHDKKALVMATLAHGAGGLDAYSFATDYVGAME